MAEISKELLQELLKNQKDEITSFHIYQALASKQKEAGNAKLLQTIAADEKKHYALLKKYSNVEVRPSKIKILWYLLLAQTLGLTFSLKLLEKGEEKATAAYNALIADFPELKQALEDEEKHEQELLSLINEERLNYMGSIVLGLNDALVELTGALAGYTFAIQNNRVIALIGLITGISASFSMAASEFLSKKQEKEENALKSSVYTGIAYIVTVFLLILPYLLFSNHFLDLGLSLLMAITVILAFNFYISVAKDLPFKKRFLEMAGISLGVTAISFGIGWAVKTFLGLEI
ncbi:MAG: rubrerythrin family protein [Firmicutes bacterium]|nr:rubrerythrin family protein [Bacillota bacterium]